MIKFHVCVKGQAINLEWDQRLSQTCERFVALKRKIGSPQSRRPSATLAALDTYVC
jgi:hypothetical protein